MPVLTTVVQLVSTSDLTFSLGDVIKFLSFAFAAGGLFMHVRILAKRQERLEGKFEELQREWVSSIKELSKEIGQLASDLRAVLANHEARLDSLEKD